MSVWEDNCKRVKGMAGFKPGTTEFEKLSPFCKSVISKAERWLLTERQVTSLQSALESLSEAELPPKGTVEVEGRVVRISMKGETEKVTLDCGKYRLYGSVPKGVEGDLEPGDRVLMLAKVTPKEAGFGFFSGAKVKEHIV